MIKIERRIRKIGNLTVPALAAVLIIGSVVFAHASGNGLKIEGIRTIVIDPGHGGHDAGVRGSGSIAEKQLAINIARILAKELKPDYEVVFTRNGDYQVDLTRRGAVANHHRGDMFISLHTGGGHRHQADVWTIFYCQNNDQRNSGVPLKTVGREHAEDMRKNWDQVQLAHHKESRTLAGCLKTQLAGIPEIRDVVVASADLRLLQGLDMPSVIIETGYLTNPKTENRLNDPDFLSDLAKRIKRGVDIYLTR